MGGKRNWIFWVENVFILLAIFVLWPRIFLGWSGLAWFAVECLVLAGLVVIFVRRTKAINKRKQ